MFRTRRIATASTKSALVAATLATLSLTFPAAAQPQDCNHNGIPDAIDIFQGQSQDLNFNGVPDECDIEVEFDQLNWSNGQGGYAEAFSDFGRASLSFDPTDLPLFFPHPEGGRFGWINIMSRVGPAQPQWTIRNLAVYFDDNENLNDRLPVGVWFSLGVPSGTPVNAIDYVIVISPGPLSAPPMGPARLGIPVDQADILIGGAEAAAGANPPAGGNSGLYRPGPATNYNGAPPGTVFFSKPAAIRVGEKQIEGVAEEVDGCGPGSIARSLKYLDAINPTITLALDAQGIYEILKGAGYISAGGPRGTATTKEITDGKKKFVKEKRKSREIGGNIDTDVEKVDDIEEDVIPALAAGADVELIVQWPLRPGQDKALQHIAFVSKITPKRNAEGELIGFDVEIIDDGKQGDADGTNKKTTLSFDKNGNMLGPDGQPNGGKAVEFVVEKYQPPPKKPPKKEKQPG